MTDLQKNTHCELVHSIFGLCALDHLILTTTFGGIFAPQMQMWKLKPIEVN